MAQGGDPTGTGTGGSDLDDIRAEFTDRRSSCVAPAAWPAAKPEQCQQPVLHHVRAGLASERPVHDLGPGGRGHGSGRSDQARQRRWRDGDDPDKIVKLQVAADVAA